MSQSNVSDDKTCLKIRGVTVLLLFRSTKIDCQYNTFRRNERTRRVDSWSRWWWSACRWATSASTCSSFSWTRWTREITRASRTSPTWTPTTRSIWTGWRATSCPTPRTGTYSAWQCDNSTTIRPLSTSSWLSWPTVFRCSVNRETLHNSSTPYHHHIPSFRVLPQLLYL